MTTAEITPEKHVTPHDLQGVFDELIRSNGELLAAGPDARADGNHTIRGFRFILTDEMSSSPEGDSSYDLEVGGHFREDPVYYWGEASRDTKGTCDLTAKRIRFRDGRASFSEHNYTWTADKGWGAQENQFEGGQLSAEELKRIHSIATNPTAKRRFNAIHDYYRDRHAQRSRTGRAIARVLKSDRPKH